MRVHCLGLALMQASNLYAAEHSDPQKDEVPIVALANSEQALECSQLWHKTLGYSDNTLQELLSSTKQHKHAGRKLRTLQDCISTIFDHGKGFSNWSRYIIKQDGLNRKELYKRAISGNVDAMRDMAYFSDFRHKHAELILVYWLDKTVQYYNNDIKERTQDDLNHIEDCLTSLFFSFEYSLFNEAEFDKLAGELDDKRKNDLKNLLQQTKKKYYKS